MDELNIIQWNARSLKANKLSFENALLHHKISIACISETWLKPYENFKINGYNILRDDRNDGYGGTSIIIKNNIPFSQVNIIHDLQDTLQLTAIEIEINYRKITIVSLYGIPKHKLPCDTWLNIIQQIKTPYLITGDFNAHAPEWGCNNIDAPGRQHTHTTWALTRLCNRHIILLSHNISRNKLENNKKFLWIESRSHINIIHKL
jgi:hypothetical protein